MPQTNGKPTLVEQLASEQSARIAAEKERDTLKAEKAASDARVRKTLADLNAKAAQPAKDVRATYAAITDPTERARFREANAKALGLK